MPAPARSSVTRTSDRRRRDSWSVSLRRESALPCAEPTKESRKKLQFDCQGPGVGARTRTSLMTCVLATSAIRPPMRSTGRRLLLQSGQDRFAIRWRCNWLAAGAASQALHGAAVMRTLERRHSIRYARPRPRTHRSTLRSTGRLLCLRRCWGEGVRFGAIGLGRDRRDPLRGRHHRRASSGGRGRIAMGVHAAWGSGGLFARTIYGTTRFGSFGERRRARAGPSRRRSRRALALRRGLRVGRRRRMR